MQTENEVLEGNKLIAEFMCYKVYEKRYPRNHGIGGGVMELPKEVILEKCKYHSSWDWLMPVVEKIESLKPKEKTTDIFGAYKISIDPWTIYFIDYSVSPEKTLIEVNRENAKHLLTDIYSAVIQFITWYNYNK